MKFCIVGTGRCGTGLLRKMFNEHPDLFVFDETHWVPLLDQKFGDAETPLDDMLDIVDRTHHVTGQPTTSFSRSAFLRQWTGRSRVTVPEFCDGLGLHFAREHQKSSWADKTPDYGYYTPLLQRLWPRCRVIHLIRDGAAVSRSMSRHIGYRALVAAQQDNWCEVALDYDESTDPPAGEPRSFVDLWYRRLSRTVSEGRHLLPGTYLEARYEDLLSSPGAELRRLCHFADIRPDAGWLEGASSLIDERRARRPRPVEMLEHFDTRHLELLSDFGYGESV